MFVEFVPVNFNFNEEFLRISAVSHISKFGDAD
jgi:hypothetical protein